MKKQILSLSAMEKLKMKNLKLSAASRLVKMALLCLISMPALAQPTWLLKKVSPTNGTNNQNYIQALIATKEGNLLSSLMIQNSPAFPTVLKAVSMDLASNMPISTTFYPNIDPECHCQAQLNSLAQSQTGVLYAAGIQKAGFGSVEQAVLLKSEDQGHAWQEVVLTRHFGEGVMDNQVSVIAVGGNALYVAISQPESIEVLRSNDAGKSWSLQALIHKASNTAGYNLILDEKNQNLLLVSARISGNKDFYRKPLNSNHWKRVQLPLLNEHQDFTLQPTKDGSYILVTTRTEIKLDGNQPMFTVLRSSNLGQTWNQVSVTPVPSVFSQLIFKEVSQGNYFLVTGNQVFESSSKGQDWVPVGVTQNDPFIRQHQISVLGPIVENSEGRLFMVALGQFPNLDSISNGKLIYLEYKK